MYPQPPHLPASPPDEEPEGEYVQVLLPDTPPTATKVLLGLIAAVYLLGVFMDQRYPGLLSMLGAKDNDRILHHAEYYRLVSVMFLHANIAHIFFNGYALWIIGQDVERFYGHLRFLLIFFLGGITASVASLAFNPAPAVGASGAVFAIFGAEMVLLYRNRHIFGAGARKRLQSLFFVLAINLAFGIVENAYIDNWAHIGGFLGGAALAWLVAPQYRVVMPDGILGQATLEDTTPAGRSGRVAAAWLGGLVGVLAALTWLG